MTITTAMVLAAGRGRRLRPLTDTIPKPLIHVGPYRLIEYHLMALSSIGVHRVVINIAHLADLIRSTIGEGSRYDMEILYSSEPPGALETAGGIHQALPLLGHDPFLVMNGDVLCDLSLDTLSLVAPNQMHLVLVPNPPHHPNGDFQLDRSSTPHRLVSASPTGQNLTYAGIGIFHPEVFQHLAAGRRPLAPLIRHGIEKEQATGEQYDGYWMDVGDPVRLALARRESCRFAFRSG